MKEFDAHQLSISKCRSQLDELKQLISSHEELEENKHILPFFRKRRDLSALIGSNVPNIGTPDQIAFELELFADFRCDLALGNAKKKSYLLVEFEDAKKNSIFNQRKGKYAPDWSQRLEHGFSQVVDWFWKLEDQKGTADFQHKFGTKGASFQGLVIVGRDSGLTEREKSRLLWRQENVIVNSKKVSVMSFDQLVEDLEFRLTQYMSAIPLSAQGISTRRSSPSTRK